MRQEGPAATGWGYLAVQDGSSATLSDSSIQFNSAPRGQAGKGGSAGQGLGGGAYNDADTTLTLSHSAVSQNQADGSPGIGGVYNTLGGTFTDHSTLIVDNDASTSGNDIG